MVDARLRRKIRGHVSEVRGIAGEREGPKGRGPAHRGDRNRQKCGGGRANSGEEIQRPGGMISDGRERGMEEEGRGIL